MICVLGDGIPGFIQSGKIMKKVCFLGQSGKVMKNQEILLKLEETQEKVRNSSQLGEFCGAQL